jgi:hypothetical protein
LVDSKELPTSPWAKRSICTVPIHCQLCFVYNIK